MAIQSFSDYLTESTKEISFVFGRFNPPTIGHEKLFDAAKKHSRGGNYRVYASRTVDAKKNPLQFKDKVKFIRKMFPKHARSVMADKDVRTVLDVAVKLYDQGFTKVTMVAGSDRVKEFDILLNKYNGKDSRHGFYNFEGAIHVVSAGERDPDSDDVSGMSASKMREFAEKGDFDSFKQGVPSTGVRFAEKLYKSIRKGMGIAESTLPSYMLEDLIQEGVYDPGTFKAVFLSGGPGSGKSAVVKKLALTALGLKMVNTDRAFENGLKKAGMSLDLRGADFSKVDPIRAKAKKITGKNLDGYIDGRLGLIFDTTSAKSDKIKSYKKLLDTLGYEYKMVFVNASLDNAQKRNDLRSRKLPSAIVKKDWDAAQKNAKEYRTIFGKDFVEITNDDDLASLDKKANSLYSKLLGWSTSFPKNKIALNWKSFELLKKDTTGYSSIRSKDAVKKPPTEKPSPFGSNLKTFKSRKTGKKTVIGKI